MELVLHIGAHRTGSTVVIKNLEANAGVLGAEGWTIWTPPMMRKMREFAPSTDAAVRAANRLAFAARLAESGAERLLISEENILGSMLANLKRATFYKSARSRLAAYAALLPAPPRRVAMGIRSYDEYWASCYAYVGMSRPLPRFSEMALAYAASSRGWLDLIDDVRAAFPDSEILVWPKHAMQGRVVAVAAQIIGRERAGLRPLRRDVNTSIGPEAIAAIEEIRAAQPGITGRAFERLLEARPALTTDAGPIWTEAQLATMRKRYKSDIRALKAGHGGVTFLRPSQVRKL